MRKFKIGDYIEANAESNRVYSITTKIVGWRGYVVRLGSTIGSIGVIGETKYRAPSDDPEFWVHEKYFDLIPDEPLVEPDADLFSGLFC